MEEKSNITNDTTTSKKTKKNLLTEEERALKIALEKENLLKNLYSNNYTDTRDKVAYILSNNINSRNSDIELAYSYWNTFENKIFNGEGVTKSQMLELTKISSLCRIRAKIQNDYNLFLADDEVRQQRGKLEEEFKKKAISDKAPTVKSLFTYIDETGKNQEYLSLGSLWLPSYSLSTITRINEIKDWKKYSEFKHEFHFTKLQSRDLDIYKLFINKFLILFPEASFKTIIIKNKGLGKIEDAITTLTYYLIKKGVEHEHSSKRAPLPRLLTVTIDEDDINKDILKLEEIKDKLTSQKIDGLTFGDFTSKSSSEELFIQIVDLFTGAINRKLHFTNPADFNYKDELADYILDLLKININEYLNDKIESDNLKMFSFIK